MSKETYLYVKRDLANNAEGLGIDELGVLVCKANQIPARTHVPRTHGPSPPVYVCLICMCALCVPYLYVCLMCATNSRSLATCMHMAYWRMAICIARCPHQLASRTRVPRTHCTAPPVCTCRAHARTHTHIHTYTHPTPCLQGINYLQFILCVW